MSCAFIVVVFALLAAERATCTISKCTANACFTLHTENVTFQSASLNCFENGGYMMTVRDHNELESVKSLLGIGGVLSVRERVWIGLKLSKGQCVLNNNGLRGFKWIAGSPDSSYSNWEKDPRNTCMEERCVSLSSEDLTWRDGSCKGSALYMCVYYFKGMCKPLLLAGPGRVHYTLQFLKVPLKQDGSLDMLPPATRAEISCEYDSDLNTVSVCKESGARFVWEMAGPFCAPAQRSCKNRNGGCNQLCLEDARAGLRCGCKEDYYLGDDKVTCFPKDPCRSKPCEHRCMPESTGFACTCFKGFELSKDNRSCKDVDECTQDVCSGHVCHNKQGSYECECKKGFINVNGVCEDIDECTESVCAHHAKCLNSEGSFSCYCSLGFKKQEEQCVDIDECLSRPCEGICSNTDGSYMCSCGPGFSLAGNGINCVPNQRRATTSRDFKTVVTVDQLAATTATPRLRTETTSETVRKLHTDGSVMGSWVLVYTLSSLIPLLLIITLTAVIAAHRWKRSRKDAKKKSATTDSYCWVSSGYTAPLETRRNRI